MSDNEDAMPLYDESSDPVNAGGDDQEQENSGKQRSKHNRQYDDEEEEDDEDEDDEDDEEDEDEDEEEEDSGRRRKRARLRKKKRSAASRFLDIEAEVEDDEEEEEEEDYAQDGFIETMEGDDEELTGRTHNALLDRKRDEAYKEEDLAQIASELSKRYGRANVRYTGDMNEVPQRLLMPSVHDASLWQVRVKPGRERDIVFSLMRKSIDNEYTARPLQILSAFQRDSLPGMIYVEARSAKQVNEAINGLVGVFPSRGIQLVPIEEMASLLQIKKQDLTVTPGSWVRIKRGKYQGDLAQVMDITENGEDVGLKFVPRIDLSPREETGIDGKKRKKGAQSATSARPPQRFFNFEEVVKVWGRNQVSKRNQVYVFQNDTYKDGFIEKDFKLSALSLENVNPTLDEITQFTRGMDGAENENGVDLSIIAEASRKAAIAVLQPGDHVEVFEGEQAGVHGVVEEVSQDVVTIKAVSVDLEGRKVDLPARSVRKRFKPGDHVKVMTGQNADETGLVVSVTDNVVTFLSDMTMQEVSVFSKDLREAAEVGSGTNIVGDYELHDLVQLDVQTVGVIFKTERDSFRVLDQNGQVRLVQPHQISMRRDSNRAIATDNQGYELRINDNMKEVDGEGRKGRVLHIHQSFFAFLHNRDIVENGGVFVTRARSLVSLAPKGNVVKTAGLDLSKMNPALAMAPGGTVGSGNMGRGPRDRIIGYTVVVIKGANKGYKGVIRDTNGQFARVELSTNNKIITIEKDKLKRQMPDGSKQPLEGSQSHMGPPQGRSNGFNGPPPRTSNPYSSGGATPAWGSTSRTPNPYAAGGRTPAWNAGARTPNPYATGDGGKTPAWNANARTPNPYADGGRTPAWNANARTPNPYASGGSGGGWGGATPGRNNTSAGGSSWGGATPGRSTTDSWGGSGNYNSSDTSQPWGGAWGAPTPAATTPGFGVAPTPAVAATPGFSYPTPAAGYNPMTGATAPTPGFASGMDLYGATETYEPPEEWLLHFKHGEGEFAGYNFKVTIQGTTNDGWYNGDMEGKEGRVTRTQDPRIGGMTSSTPTASVQIPGMDNEVTIPVKYLVPQTPNGEAMQLNCPVAVLDGPFKGEVFILRDYGDRTCSVSKQQSSFQELSTNVLAMLANA